MVVIFCLFWLELPEKPSEDYAKAGGELLREGKFKEAVEKLEKALKENPDNTKLRFELAVAYEALADLKKAKEHYLKTLELEPKNVEVHYRLSLIYWAEGEKERAISELKTCLKEREDFIGAIRQLAYYYTEEEKYELAVEQYLKLLELKPFGTNLADIHTDLGKVYLKMGLEEEAKAEFEKALEIDSDYEEAKAMLETLKLTN